MKQKKQVKEDVCIYCDGDPTGFMICCDRCEVWYHYKCIHKKWDLNLRPRQVIRLKKYFCYPCRRANPSLKVIYRSPKNNVHDEQPKASKSGTNSSSLAKAERQHHQQKQPHLARNSFNSPMLTSTPSTGLSTSVFLHLSESSPEPASSSSSSSSSAYYNNNNDEDDDDDDDDDAKEGQAEDDSSTDSMDATSNLSPSSSKSDEAIENKKPPTPASSIGNIVPTSIAPVATQLQQHQNLVQLQSPRRRLSDSKRPPTNTISIANNNSNEQKRPTSNGKQVPTSNRQQPTASSATTSSLENAVKTGASRKRKVLKKGNYPKLRSNLQKAMRRHTQLPSKNF